MCSGLNKSKQIFVEKAKLFSVNIGQGFLNRSVWEHARYKFRCQILGNATDGIDHEICDLIISW